MQEPPQTLPEDFHGRWMDEADINRFVERNGYGTITKIATRFVFAKRTYDGWDVYDHALFGNPADAVPLAEVAVQFACAPAITAIVGHDPVSAADIALRLSAKAIDTGARLHAIKDSIDTTYMDLSDVEDMRINLIGQNGIHEIVYRQRDDADWRWDEPLRFMSDEKRKLTMIDIASCSADKTGFVRLDTQYGHSAETFDAVYGGYPLYLCPSSVKGIVAGRNAGDIGEASLNILYGRDRVFRISFGEDLGAARFAVRRMLSTFKHLRPIDEGKCIHVDPMQFSAINFYEDSAHKVHAGSESTSVYLHFRDRSTPIAIVYGTTEAAILAMKTMNVRAAEARKPRMVPVQAGAEILRLRPRPVG